MTSYVHHCAFCGWSRPADDVSILDPACERCGCTLTADTLERYEESRRTSEGERRERTTWDMTGPLSVVLIAAMVLPMVGFELGDVVFALPFIMLVFAATRCVVAARRGTALRWTWRSMAVGAGLAGAASAIALVTAMGDLDSTIAFYVGALAAVAMVGPWRRSRSTACVSWPSPRPPARGGRFRR